MDNAAVAPDPCIAADEIGVPHVFGTYLSRGGKLAGSLLLVSQNPSLDGHSTIALRARLLRSCSKAFRMHPATLRLIRDGGTLLAAAYSSHEAHIAF